MQNLTRQFVAALILWCFGFLFNDEAFAADVTVGEFLKSHCHRCHGTDKQEAEVRLDSLADPTAENELAGQW